MSDEHVYRDLVKRLDVLERNQEEIVLLMHRQMDLMSGMVREEIHKALRGAHDKLATDNGQALQRIQDAVALAREKKNPR